VNDKAETLERLRAEIAELRASRQRLVAAADADREKLERELHDGVQQHLVALAVKLQVAGSSLASDAGTTRTLLDELECDVQDAVEAAAQLAQRMCPQLQVGGLAAALRAVAVSAGVPASVDVPAESSYPPATARTIYLCWLEALERGGGTITVRGDADVVSFEVLTTAGLSSGGFERLRDRVEGLGGRLAIRPERDGTRVSGSLPR
jgi:signal transduction histidine kinase